MCPRGFIGYGTWSSWSESMGDWIALAFADVETLGWRWTEWQYLFSLESSKSASTCSNLTIFVDWQLHVLSMDQPTKSWFSTSTHRTVKHEACFFFTSQQPFKQIINNSATMPSPVFVLMPIAAFAKPNSSMRGHVITNQLVFVVCQAQCGWLSILPAIGLTIVMLSKWGKWSKRNEIF